MNQKFFERNPRLVAKDLIGCFLCTPQGRFMIVEVESYGGREDKGSHSSKGETKRNTVMFGPPYNWYVYFTYGMHHMLNIVCNPKGEPGAVLIRGVVSEDGKQKLLGPAILTKYLKIDRSFNTKPSSKKTGLWIEPPTSPPCYSNGVMYGKKFKILATPRIGIDYAGPIWSKKKYRFVVKEFETKKFK